MLASSTFLATMLAVVYVVFGKELEAQRNFQLRECRQRSWRGDVADLPPHNIYQEHPRDVKVHSRHRRFIAWPSGSTLSIYPGFSIPKASFNDGWNSLGLYLGFPMTMNLPDAPIIFKGTTTTTTTAAPSYGSYAATTTSSYGKTNNRQDDVPSNPYNHYNNYASDFLHNYPNGYSSYSSYDPFGPYSKRSVDSQRQTGFSIIQNGLENLGLPGKSCLLRAVCEVAEEPVSDLGFIGDVLNLFLAAGYGEGADEMTDFVAAEDVGRQKGDCSNQYSECPLPLANLLQGGLSYLHAGLADAGIQSNGFL